MGGTLLAGLRSGVHAGALSVVGRRISAETARYQVEFLDGVIVQVTNRLTAEPYTAADDPGGVLGELPTGLSSARGSPNYGMVDAACRMHQHISGHEPAAAVESYACQHKPFAGSRVEVRRRGPAHLVVTYRGLWDGRPLPDSRTLAWAEGREFVYPSETYTLELQIDPRTDDLVIHPTAGAEVPGVCGVAFTVANVRDEVRLIRSMYCGTEALGAEEPETCTGLRWPSQWAVPLVIGAAPAGCFALWTQDPDSVTKYLHLRHRRGRWCLTVESLGEVPFGDKRECRGVAWRFNTFRGDWRGPADRYKAWLSASCGLTPRSRRRPGWMADIRAVVWSGFSEGWMRALAEALPAERIAIINVPPFENAARYPSVHWKPNSPLENPTRFGIDEGYRTQVRLAHDLGYRVLTWMPFSYTDAVHPLAARFWHARAMDYFEDHTKRSLKEVRIHPGCKGFRRLWAGWVRDVFERLGTDGMYFDVCPVDGTNLNGPIDGLSLTAGTRALLADFVRAFPERAVTGEYFNEVCAPAYHLANATYIGHYGMDASRRRARRAHPLIQYLFGDAVLLSTWWPGSGESFHLALDQEEASGYAPSLDGADALPDADAEARLRLTRARWFIEQDVTNDWPDLWHPAVKSYWRGKDGRRYGVLWDPNGSSRCVELTAGGEPTDRVIYARISGATRVALDGGLPHWIGYAGREVIGLNPAQRYIVLGDARPAGIPTVTALPEGAYLANTRTYPEATVVEVRSLGQEPAAGELRFAAGPLLRRVMTQSADAVLAPGQTGGAFRVTTPATVAFVTDELPLPAAGMSLSGRRPRFARFELTTAQAFARETPSNYFQPVTRHADGKTHPASFLLADYYPERAEYLVRVPAAPVLGIRVRVAVSPQALNRKEFHVWVNGQEALCLDGEPGATVTGVVGLGAYRDRTVLLSLWGTRPVPDNRTGPHEWHLGVIESPEPPETKGAGS
jgi:hypothetical protein